MVDWKSVWRETGDSKRSTSIEKPVDKELILSEVRRTATENQGRPLGRQRFQKETGIRVQSVLVKLGYRRWSDVLQAAGFEANELQSAYDPELLCELLAELTRELGSFPTSIDIRIKSEKDDDFPTHNSFRRLGPKSKRIQAVLDFCQREQRFSDLVPILQETVRQQPAESTTASTRLDTGYVYLVKSGRYYKIGHTNSVERRSKEITIQLPEDLTTVHIIQTDDPPGIEAYWHHRFKAKRKKGEWFELSAADVAAFRRRRFM